MLEVVTAHARMRAQERLGFVPSAAEWCEVMLKILAAAEWGKTLDGARFMGSDLDGTEVWRVRVRNREGLFAWNMHSAMFLTVLTNHSQADKCCGLRST